VTQHVTTTQVLYQRARALEAQGVSRDYRVAVQTKERAVQQGVSIDPSWRL